MPLVVRGPGVSKNLTSELPVLNIDIAPTLVDIATNGNPDVTMDGVSFKKLLNVCFIYIVINHYKHYLFVPRNLKIFFL